MVSFPEVTGWSFFGISVIVSQFLSLAIVLWLKKSSSHSVLYLVVGVPMCLSFLSLFIIPVDVFFTSYMKDSVGNFKPWASDPHTRNILTTAISVSYYFLLGVSVFMTYVLYPFTLFVYNEDSGFDETARPKIKRAFIFTFIFIIVMGIIFITGLFMPDSAGIKTSEGLLFILIRENSVAKKILRGLGFHVFFLQVFGTLISITYTAYGLSIVPLKCLNLSKKTHDYVRLHNNPDSNNPFIITSEETENVSSEPRTLKSCCSKFFRVLIAPFRILIGLTALILSYIVIISLIITCVDKWINSGGIKTGYYLENPKIFNPIDYLFLKAQKVFPIDYILMGLVFFLFGLSSIFAIKMIGIRIVFVRIFTVRTRKTNPQSLVLFSILFNFMCISFGYLFWTILTDYLTYGNQNYLITNPEKGTSVVVPCTRSSPSEHCMITTFAKILVSLNLNSNFVGTVMFFLQQLFAFSFIIGAFVSAYFIFIKKDHTDVDSLQEFEDEEISTNRLVSS